jgi:hypothetical protein
MILKGGPGWTSVYKGTEQDYPKSYSLLKDYTESKEAFLIRKAKWILSNDEINTSSRTRVGQAVHCTGLSRDVIQMLNSQLRL